MEVRRWLVLAVLSVSSSGCGQTGTTVRFLRSETYTFTASDRSVIEAIAQSATREVRGLLPGLPSSIELTVRAGSDVIKETGETADAMPPTAVMWTVDPGREGGVAAVARNWLRATLFHEFHHLVRSASGNPRSVVDHALFEGMATVFERDAAGVYVPWGDYPADVDVWAREVIALPSDSSVREWLFSHPDGRRWVGIKVGAFWVDRAIAASGRSSAELVAVPTDEILEMAQAGK
jgi:hypothetical protein